MIAAEQKKSIIEVKGETGGTHDVLVTKTKVQTKQGSKLDVKVKGDAFIAITETGGSQAEGTKDEVIIKRELKDKYWVEPDGKAGTE